MVTTSDRASGGIGKRSLAAWLALGEAIGVAAGEWNGVVASVGAWLALGEAATKSPLSHRAGSIPSRPANKVERGFTAALGEVARLSGGVEAWVCDGVAARVDGTVATCDKAKDTCDNACEGCCVVGFVCGGCALSGVKGKGNGSCVAAWVTWPAERASPLCIVEEGIWLVLADRLGEEGLAAVT